MSREALAQEGWGTGYLRPDGRVGLRNHLLVVPTCVCSAHCALRIADLIPEAVSFYHQHGCAQLASDRDQTARALSGTGSNPNVGAVLVVGLGCENVTATELAGAIAATGKPVAQVVIQEEGGARRTVLRGAALCRGLIEAMRATRTVPVAPEMIVLGVECGGSDALSGLTANPVVGWVADEIVEAGGTVILSETTELIGAEHLLAARAIGPAIAEQLLFTVRRIEAQIKQAGLDLRGANPAPGNIAGGLTTIEEKSLGCVRKGGTSPLREVVPYAVRPTTRGLVFMDTPGHDVESVTGMVAGGAQVVLFTTGRGTPTGSPVAPVIKVATNDRVWTSMRPDLDFNAGGVASGREGVEAAGRRLLELLKKVAGGKKTRAEESGHHDFAIYRVGPTV